MLIKRFESRTRNVSEKKYLIAKLHLVDQLAHAPFVSLIGAGEHNRQTQVVDLFEMRGRSQDRGVIFVTPKLRRVENIIGRQIVLRQLVCRCRAFIQRERWSRMRKDPDFVVRHAVKPLHFALACFGADDDEGGVLQDLGVKTFSPFQLAVRAYFRKRWLQSMLQIPNDRRKRNFQGDRFKRGVEKKLDSFRSERVVDPFVLPGKSSFPKNKKI